MWQILFVVGIVVGYFFRELEKNFIELPSKFRLALCGILFCVTTITLIASVLFVYFPGYGAMLSSENINLWFDKATLSPLRLILAMVWFTTIFALVRRYENFFVKHLGWLLLPIGRNSLSIYIFQSVLLYALYPILSLSTGFGSNFLINALSILLVWLFALYVTRHRFAS